ncbi:MAG: MOSC domain-containing protein [Nitrospirae bacterium]|nr:MAG: MOSC domain-containing protein [Nitrospirota bacterium]
MTSKTGRSYLHQISVSNGGLPKLPVPQARITKERVEGDRQKTPLIHGGPDRAVCLFSLELIEALQAEGHPIKPGSSGDNLTLAGVDWAGIAPGSRIAVGNEVRLEVVSYTAPCKQNTCLFHDGDFSRISQDLHPGWSRLYARVLAEGTVCVGDAVTVEEA